MLSMSINHPDIEEFITKKQDLTKVTGANISVKVTDEFMKAVENDEDYLLRWPINQDLSYFSKEYLDIEYNKLAYLEDHRNGNNIFYIKKIKAKELWNKLMHCAWNTAEPGIMFEDTMHDYSPDGIYDRFKMISTNPCGEIPMGPFDSCRLIHLNLTSFIDNPFTDKAVVNEEKLYEVSYEAMRLSDDLVDLEIEAVDRIINVVANESDSTEFNLWSRIKETAIKGRRAGLGFTGLADAIAMLGLKYDSDEGLDKVEYIMKIMFKAQLDCQCDMAVERGSFPAWDKSKELVVSNSWYRWVQENYPKEYSRMLVYSRRNISWSSVAPTGTVSIMAQCSSGIEPVFLPFYERKRKCMSPEDRVDYTDIKGEKYTLFKVFHPNFLNWYIKESQCEHCPDVAMEALQSADSESLNKIFRKSPYYGSTASEIDWHRRIKLQGIVQRYITHSISSTINLPNETTEEEIANIYMEAWKEGNKGQTIYRDGCREGVLNKVEKPKTIDNRQAPKRPKELEADYYQIKVKGEQFIVLVGLLDNKPYEIFTCKTDNLTDIPEHKGKITKIKKMHYAFDSEYIHIENLNSDDVEEKAATLYSSMLLRHGVGIEYIIKTAKKVNDNIVSFSSAMCRILSRYITKSEVKGETCPECGGRLVRDGGCLHCIDCGYSKCLMFKTIKRKCN